MRLDFVHAESLGRVGPKHAHNEVKGVRVDRELSALQSFLGIGLKAEVPLVVGGSFVERLHGGQHHEEHHAHSEDVDSRAVVHLSGMKFRRHVVSGSAFSLEDGGVGACEAFHKPEVSDFDSHVLVQEAVVKLEVTVSNALRV